jgi:oxygen-independent coproporphyrinogen III oxidase
MKSAPLQLYVHVPFCEKKCHYCDFASWELPASRQRPWTETLLREIEVRGRGLAHRPIRTVFFGGGTPSVLASEFLEDLVLALKSHFDCSQVEEWSMECNPSSLNRQKLDAMYELGFNRVSVGIQSFHGDELTRLGRVHSPAGAHAALQCLVEDGRFAFSGDLIFGQPGQTLSSFSESLRQLVQYRPSHVSFYGLTIETGTEFDKQAQAGKLTLPEAEHYNAQYLSGVEYLAKQGYDRYEVSNFARPGLECKHNQGYWDGIEYLALGPGASSLLAGVRTVAPKNFEAYMDWGAKGFPVVECEQDVLDKDAYVAEKLFLQLRQAKGLVMAELEKAFQVTIPASALAKWEKAECVAMNQGVLTLKSEGWLLLDEVVSDLLAKLVPA